MASVPCRCGHSWTVPGRGPAAVGHAGQQRRGVLQHHVGPAVQDRRRPPRPSRPAPASRSRRGRRRPGRTASSAAASSARWSGTSADEVPGLPPPARLGPPAQRAEPGARGVDQDPVEGPGRPRRRRAVGGHDAQRRRRRPGQRPADQAGPVRLPLGGRPARPRARPPAPASSAALPPGPAQRSSQRSSRPVDAARPPAPARPAGSPRPARRRGPRRPPRPRRGRRRPARTPYGDQRRRLARQLVAGRAAGSGHQGDAGRLVVGGQQGVELVGAPRAAVRQLLDHPAGVAVGDGQAADAGRRRRRARPGDPPGQVVLGHPAQHGVGEPGRPRPDLGRAPGRRWC